MGVKGFLAFVFVFCLFLVGAVGFDFFGFEEKIKEDNFDLNLRLSNVSNLLNFRFNWDGVSYDIYDEDLILMMDFNNDSSLGENDSVVRDLSRYGHHGVVLGGASAVGSGKYNGAYSFSEGEGINISPSEDFNVDEFTISLWVKPSTEIKFKQFSVDAHTSCLLSTNNDVYCSGYNTYGQVGNNQTTNTKIFYPFAWNDDYDISNVQAGNHHSCALLTNGSAICWGKGTDGQLGNGLGTDSVSPVFVFGNYNFKQIGTGREVTCGLLYNGTLLCWGDNIYGQLGDNSTTDRLIPTPVYGNHNFSKFWTSREQNCGILTNGSAMCWGRNDYGQLGDNSTTDRLIPTSVYGNYAFEKVFPEYQFSCGLLYNGSVLCWGRNDYGQLGVNLSIEGSSIPLFIDCPNCNFSNLFSGRHFAFGKLQNGILLAWGRNDWGQIGSFSYKDSPLKVFDTQIDLEEIIGGLYSVCGLDENGNIFCWGSGASFGISIGTGEDDIYESKFFLIKKGVEEVCSGGSFSCLKNLDDKNYYCFGDNSYGQLGRDGNPIFTNLSLCGNYDFSSIDCLRENACGILTNGSVLCWGRNDYGQIGDNSTINRNVPTMVFGDYNFSLISSGAFHNCGILTNGSVLCWGRNDYGQLGDGNLGINSDVPVFVSGDHSFLSIIGGTFHNCGILTNGSAMCWGRNNFGQLGDGNLGSNSDVPVFVSGNHSFLSIDAGFVHNCGILTNGSVMCWGRNNFGQLGDGNLGSNSDVPVFVSGDYNFSLISSGVFHNCGILTNGSAMCWGRNDYGQLGDGNLGINSDVPSMTYGKYSFLSISLGTSHTCAISDSNDLFCVGRNNHGQLGNLESLYNYPSLPLSSTLFSKSFNDFSLGLSFSNEIYAYQNIKRRGAQLNSLEWNNIVFISGDTFKLYVNGEMVNSMIFPRYRTDFLDDLEIGKNSNAEIDDLIMWNRSLSDEEVEFVYKSNLEKLNGSSWSFSTSFSDLVEKTYDYGVFVRDGFGWVSSLRSLVVDFPDRGSGGSTGSSTFLSFSDGVVERGFPKGHVLSLEKGNLKVESFDFERVVLSFDGGIVNISLNESGKVDLDGDGFYDIEVGYSGGVSDFAGLVISEIYEKVTSVSEKVVVEEKSQGEFVDFERGSSLVYWIVGGIVVLGFAGWWFFYKSFGKKKSNI